MEELRWILLLIGLVFLIGLAAWETRRARQSRVQVRDSRGFADRGRADADRTGSDRADGGRADVARTASLPARGLHREPQLGELPQLGQLETQPIDEFHEAAQDTRAADVQPEEVALTPESAPYPSLNEVPLPEASLPKAVPEQVEGAASDNAGDTDRGMAAAGSRSPQGSAELAAEQAARAAGAATAAAPAVAAEPDASSESAACESAALNHGNAGMTEAVDAQHTAPADPAAPTDWAEAQAVSQEGGNRPLVVDWPPEGARQIISVRIVGSSEQRLSGRATRQALAACGFVHGRYRIFHQPCSDGRALLSCASLSKPGNFDPASMDFQRFTGLSLFTVLPGPLPPPLAVERLIETARDLTERLQARLQDDRGQMLDSTRIAALRASAQEPPAGMGMESPV